MLRFAPVATFRTILAASLLVAASQGSARAEEEVARERYVLRPRYAAGESWRVVKQYRQSTVTNAAIGFFGGKTLNFSDYDAYVDLDATVTVENVDENGKAQVWAIRLDKFRFDVPNPLESEETRARMSEGKRQHMPREAHPLEGEVVKIDRTKPKTRIFKVLRNGEDAGITARYPEIIPLTTDLIEPDWLPTDSVPLYGEWEMPAEHLFRLTDVVLRNPLQGKIRCKLASVVDGIATIELSALLGQEFRRVKMEISTKGRVLFDVNRRRHVLTEHNGEVQISSKTSNLRGTGTTSGRTVTTPIPVAPEPGVPAKAGK
jgi:hypothetical protein